MPQKEPKCGLLWLADGSCFLLRALPRNHVWSWDFVMDQTDDGRLIKVLTLIDEYTKEALAIYPARRTRVDSADRALTSSSFAALRILFHTVWLSMLPAAINSSARIAA